MTSSELVGQFVQYLGQARRLTKSTGRAYTTDLLQFSQFLTERGIVDPDLLTVTQQLVVDFLDGLKATSPKNKKAEDVYRPRSLNRKLACLKSFYKWAMRTGRIIANPTDKIRPLHTEPYPLVDPFSKEEFQKILAIRKKRNELSDARNIALILLLWDTGLQISKVQALNLTDLRGKNTTRMYILVKTELIELNEQTTAALKEYLIVRNKTFPTVSEPVFLNKVGARLSCREIRRMIRKRAKEVGIGHPITPRLFRRWKIQTIVAENSNIGEMAKKLGFKKTAYLQQASILPSAVSV